MLRPNVPAEFREQAVRDLRGYYSYIAALDSCFAIVHNALREVGLEDDTILVFTADHGDMRGSQALETKLFPWDESVRAPTGEEAALLSVPAEFHELRLNGMKAYRGLRTRRHTYVRNLDGPWLLYDNETDPYQMSNLAGRPEYADLQTRLDSRLQQRLHGHGDRFLDGWTYLARDGLTHYREVNDECRRAWQDPWR